jgi:hypothetical protein
MPMLKPAPHQVANRRPLVVAGVGRQRKAEQETAQMLGEIVIGSRGANHARPRALKRDLLRRGVLALLSRLKIKRAAERAGQAQNEAKRGDLGVTRQKPTHSAPKHGARLIP